MTQKQPVRKKNIFNNPPTDPCLLHTLQQVSDDGNANSRQNNILQHLLMKLKPWKVGISTDELNIPKLNSTTITEIV